MCTCSPSSASRVGMAQLNMLSMSTFSCCLKAVVHVGLAIDALGGRSGGVVGAGRSLTAADPAGAAAAASCGVGRGAAVGMAGGASGG
eukprot:8329665-Pyramimonas_sp.AAC.1